MGIIFLDLEFSTTLKKAEAKGHKTAYEIIEIGAVKLDEEFKICEKFDTFVKPIYGNVNAHVTHLTGITNEMVKDAPIYEDAMNDFLAWVGDEDYDVYSWSECDWKQIYNEAEQKEYQDVRLDKLLDHWIDFQRLYGDMLGFDKQISLKHALGSADISFEGHMHSALADAANTAELFRMSQQPDFKDRIAPIVELLSPKEELSFSMGSLFSEEMLKGLCVG